MLLLGTASQCRQEKAVRQAAERPKQLRAAERVDFPERQGRAARASEAAEEEAPPVHETIQSEMSHLSEAATRMCCMGGTLRICRSR